MTIDLNHNTPEPRKGLPAEIGHGEPTMTSLEIAEVVESRHDNVKVTIERLAKRGVITLPAMQEVSNPGAGPKTITVYLVGKRDSYVIVAQLSPEFTARLVDRWQELEAKVAHPDPIAMLNDPAAMRGLLLTYTEKVIALEGEVAEMRPQAEALERIARSEGSLCITDAAKTLQVRPKDLFDFLRSHRWIYTRVGSSSYIAFQSKLAVGLLEHKTTTVTKSDGSEKTVTQVRITPKGLTRLATEFPPAVRLS